MWLSLSKVLVFRPVIVVLAVHTFVTESTSEHDKTKVFFPDVNSGEKKKKERMG